MHTHTHTHTHTLREGERPAHPRGLARLGANSTGSWNIWCTPAQNCDESETNSSVPSRTRRSSATSAVAPPVLPSRLRRRNSGLRGDAGGFGLCGGHGLMAAAASRRAATSDPWDAGPHAILATPWSRPMRCAPLAAAAVRRGCSSRYRAWTDGRKRPPPQQQCAVARTKQHSDLPLTWKLLHSHRIQ